MSELLAPAGDLEKLYWAAAFGADAVYFGMKKFSLRSFAGNLSLEEAQQGLKHLHSLGKKGYVTLNIYPRTDEYEELYQIAGALSELGVDAFIASDLGVISMLMHSFPKIPIHISTQANSVSSQTALFYHNLGAKRVNLARELSFDQIAEIQKQIAGRIETEVFIHGAVCFSYSGRCAISDYLTSRGANSGRCAQSCRWSYHLMEETRPGEFFPVFEDDRGLYLMNSKDLALFKYMVPLSKLGVTSFKIEGRMKGLNYLATLLSVYRKILDGESYDLSQVMSELYKISNRGYSEGFMKGTVSMEDYRFERGGYDRNSVILLHTLPETVGNMRKFSVKESAHAGESLEVLKSDGTLSEYTLPSPLLTDRNEEVQVVHNNHTLLLPDIFGEYALLRRIIK